MEAKRRDPTVDSDRSSFVGEHDADGNGRSRQRVGSVSASSSPWSSPSNLNTIGNAHAKTFVVVVKLTGVIPSSTWVDAEQEEKTGHEDEDHFDHDEDVRLSNEERTSSSSGSLILSFPPSNKSICTVHTRRRNY